MPKLSLASRPVVLVSLVTCGLALLVVLFMPNQNGLAAIAVVFSDGLMAAIILASAACAGLSILYLLLPITAFQVDRLTYLLLAVALGLGFLSLATLGLGLAGLLSRGFFIVLLLLPAPTGLLILQKLSLQPNPPCMPGNPGKSVTSASGSQMVTECYPIGHLRWLWLLAAVPLGLGILGAALPPGILWPSEARGYDVLEYHLAGPKEYLNTGRICFLSHNVYTNMPSNVEMLYLLGMLLKSNSSSTPQIPELLDQPRIPPPYNAVYLVNFLNLWIAVLAVLALYRTAGHLYAHSSTAGLVLACCPWLLVVATMAYVEVTLLLYTILAVLVVLGGKQLGLSPARSAILAGVFVGLACGCKLTAVVFVALPVLILLLLLRFLTARFNIRAILIYLSVAFLVFCPWLAKNLVFTGNPFFPLFYNQFGGRDFSVELAERWNAGHAFTSAPHSYTSKLQALYQEFLIHPQFGLAVMLLPIPALLLAWRKVNPHRLKVDLPLFVLFGCQLLAWIGFTYMPSRFFLLALVPLCLLAGRSVILMASGVRRKWLIPLLIILACITGPIWSVRTFLEAVCPIDHIGLQDRVGMFLGQDSLGIDCLSYVNTVLPGKSHILMVGDATSFYWTRRTSYNTVFNINPLAQQVRVGLSPRQIIDWLASQGFTHVYVDFFEINRLANTYGYPPEITPRLFAHLEQAGLVELKRFSPHGPAESTPPAILYRVVASD